MSTLLINSQSPPSALIHGFLNRSRSVPNLAAASRSSSRQSHVLLLSSNLPRRRFRARAVEPSTAKTSDDEESKSVGNLNSDAAAVEKAVPVGWASDYPTGEFEMEEFGWWRCFVVKVRMLFALPWERVRKRSVLSMQLRGQVWTVWFSCS